MTKQLNFLGGEKKKEKNSPTIFDTLNTPKAKMDDAKNFFSAEAEEKRAEDKAREQKTRAGMRTQHNRKEEGWSQN